MDHGWGRGRARSNSTLRTRSAHSTARPHRTSGQSRSDSRESQRMQLVSGTGGQGSTSPGTRVQFRMDPPQSCPNVVSLQIGRGVPPPPPVPLSPGAASTSSTGVSSRACGLAVAYVSCHWRESRLGRRKWRGSGRPYTPAPPQRARLTRSCTPCACASRGAVSGTWYAVTGATDAPRMRR